MSEPVATPPRWTPAQRAAIEHIQGDLLVSAAAGSGKTAVLAERCARLVAEGHCGVDALLVLTFTDAAANEMRSRIAAAIRTRLNESPNPDDLRRLEKQAAMVERASISTLHAFCARILRQHFHTAGVDPAFELIDEEEADLLRQETHRDLLAQWNRPATPTTEPAADPDPNTDPAARENFPAFYEAYAQGRDSAVTALLEKVYHMLASSADPAAWKRTALAAYAADRPQTLARFAQETVARRVRMIHAAADRACTLIAAEIGPGQLLTELQSFRDRTAEIAALLTTRGFAAWDESRARADIPKWPTIKTPKDNDNFKPLKERTWDKLKDAWNKTCEDLFPADAATLDADLAATAIHLRTLLALVEDFSTRYADAKRRQNCLDFADLERFALDLLTAPTSLAARELRARYHHLLVDEFQDINPLQAALLQAVRNTDRDPAGNLFVVGDVKQSIYGFRLADPHLFLAREKAAREIGPAAYVPLSINFRSQPALLAIMNGLFEKLLTPPVAGLDYADGHALQPPPPPAAPSKTAPNPESLLPFTGAPAELHLIAMNAVAESDDDSADEGPTDTDTDHAKQSQDRPSTVEAEAQVVAARIQSLMSESRAITRPDGALTPLRYRDIAILLRSMKNKALVFARALARAGIPVHADLSTGYFEAPEVCDVLAILQILDNPLQDIPLATALLSPFGRFSFDDLAAIRLAYDRKTVPFALAAARYAEENALPHPDTPTPPHSDTSLPLPARLAAFFEKLAAWRATTRTRPLHEALGTIYAESHIVAYLSGLDAGLQRVANLQMLHQRALQFAGFRKQGLHRFLRFLERLRQQEGDFGEAPVLSEASDVVRIMSVHKSKGLEFPVIIASGLGSNFNFAGDAKSGGAGVTVHRDLHIGMKAFDPARDALFPTATSLAIAEAQRRSARAEELRLLYVALTRARDHLILTGTLAKAETLADLRDAWRGHRGPLPEDVILKGGRFLDWILPALAIADSTPGNLRVQWPTENLPNAQVHIQLHAPAPLARAAADTPTPDDPALQSLLAAQPLTTPTTPIDSATETLALRITGAYPHAAFAHQPAVLSVSQLKKDAADLPDPDEFSTAPLPNSHRAPLSDSTDLDARSRGIATHRLLELLDFAALPSPSQPAAPALETQILKLFTAGSLTKDQAAAIDRPALLWFLSTDLAREIAATARQTPHNLRREIPFAWTCPTATPQTAPSPDPRDWPTIRGIIDLLLITDANGDAPSAAFPMNLRVPRLTGKGPRQACSPSDPPAQRECSTNSVSPRRARILDYKTDSLRTWQLHLPEYRQQMRYYLQAAQAILGTPVTHATLIFLTPRHFETITL